MARMLQALKNLESKAVRSPGTNGAAQADQEVRQKSEAVPANATRAVTTSVPAANAVIPRAAEVVDRLDAVLAGELSSVSAGPAVSVTSTGNDFGFTDFAFFGQRPVHRPLP